MKYITYEDYLRIEAETDIRHEWLDGECWAMSGGSIQHAKVKVNTTVWFSNQLGDGPCQTYDADLKFRVGETGLATYPDLAVICGKPERHPGDRHAQVNPTLLVEVVSPSTEGHDRGLKFAYYRMFASLRYVLWVDPLRPRVDLATRTGDDRWELTSYLPGSLVPLPSLGLELPVDALFRNVPPVEPEDREDRRPSLS